MQLHISTGGHTTYRFKCAKSYLLQVELVSEDEEQHAGVESKVQTWQ